MKNKKQSTRSSSCSGMAFLRACRHHGVPPFGSVRMVGGWEDGHRVTTTSCARRLSDHKMLCILNIRPVKRAYKPIFFRSLQYDRLSDVVVPARLSVVLSTSRIVSKGTASLCQTPNHTQVGPLTHTK